MHKHHVSIVKDEISKEEEEGQQQYLLNWKDAIFLPFNEMWRMVLMVTIFCNTFIIIYVVTFAHDTEAKRLVDRIYYLFEVIYLCDTALYILHRNMPVYAATREFDPRHPLFLMVDLITLLPIREVYLLLNAVSHLHENTSKTDYIRLKSIFRTYRIFHYLTLNEESSAGLKQYMIIYAGHVAKVLILNHILAAIWYLLKCYKCNDGRNWTDNLSDHIFDPNSPSNWYVISYGVVSSMYAHNWAGPIRAEAVTERLFAIATMIIGYVTHIVIFFGWLLGALVKLYRRQFEFEKALNRITKLLDYWEVDKELKAKTLNFYETFWKMRSGIKDTPACFKLMPPSMQKEVTIDIYWEALRHSHLLRDLSMSFKRSLSLEMKCEFCMQGDYVFRKNHIKNKMVYIVSGVLQVLTDEDEQSPILSLSSGTILSEISMFLPTMSTANVRCATYCELHTLDVGAMHNTLKKYPDVEKHLTRVIDDRIAWARNIHDERQGEEIPRESTIRWIKLRWRELSKLQLLSKKKVIPDRFIAQNSSRLYSSKYLDLLVLSEKVELKIKAICLRGDCPFVLEPHSSFRRCCEYINLAVIITQSIILPYYAFFERKIVGKLFSYCFMLDIMYFLDIYIQLSTAIKKQNQTILRPKDIVVYRIKSLLFWVDVFATIPIDYFSQFIGTSLHSHALWRLNRLLKAYKVITLITKKEMTLGYDVKLKYIKYSIIFFGLIYWVGSLLYFISCPNEQCEEFGWVRYNRKLALERRKIDLYEHDPNLFLRSLYVSLNIMISLHMSKIYFYRISEMFFVGIVTLLNYFIFSFCLVELTAVFLIRGLKRHFYHETLRTIKNYLISKSLATSLKGQFIRYLHFQWNYNENAQVFGEDGIFNEAHEGLKNKIIKERILECLQEVPLFVDCERGFVNKVAEKGIIRVLPPDAVLTMNNCKTDYMYVILRGYCTEESYMSGDRERATKTTLQRGDCFPVIEMLHKVLVFIKVTAVTSVEVIEFHQDDIRKLVQGYIMINREISMCLDTHYKSYEATLMRRRGRLPEMISTEKSLEHGDMFTYEIHYQKKTDKLDQAFLEPYKKLGKWGYVRFLLMRRTINTHHRFYIYWEIFICCTVVFKIPINLTHYTLFIKHQKAALYVQIIFECISLIDMYIRLHCQYYNKKGILVTHPWCTAKHYMRTAMAADIYGHFPLHILQIHKLFGHSNHEMVYTIIVTITRPIQLYRIFGGISYLQENVSNKSGVFLLTLKYGIATVMLLATFANILLMITCNIRLLDKGTYEVVCRKNSWLTNNPLFKLKLEPIMIYLQCLYLSVVCYTTASSGTFSIINYYEIIVVFPLLCLMYGVKWHMLCHVISSKIAHNITVTQYQEHIKNFYDFIRVELVDENLANATVKHYRHIGVNTQGMNITKSLANFHPKLQEDLTFFLYAPTLKAVDIFAGANDGFYRALAAKMNEVHFMKDAEIIRCNDIQGQVYFVHKGRVDVLVANMKLCTMSKGSIFGCVDSTGSVRQTITVKAKVHVVLLTMNSVQFRKLVSDYPAIKGRIKQMLMSQMEYYESSKVTNIEASMSFSLRSNIVPSRSRRFFTIIVRSLRVLINEQNYYYKIWSYVICVHFSTITSTILLFWIVMTNWRLQNTIINTTVLTLIDFVYIIKIYVEFHTSYVDPDSGLTITEFGMIAKRYLRSLFWLDLFSTFPFQLFFYIGTTNSDVWKFGFLNRVLRYMFLIVYYNKCKEKLKVKAHLRWTNLIYTIIFNFQWMACIWWVTACYDHKCSYIKKTGHYQFEIQKSNSTFESIFITYSYLANAFSASSLRDVAPYTLMQLVVASMIALFFLMMVISLASGFATLLYITNFTMYDYDYDLDSLETYLEGRQLSHYIMRKVRKYFLELWQRQHGKWMPVLITDAPPYLKQDLMRSLYGNLIGNHFLFARIHSDFFRQIVVHLQRCFYFPGCYLLEKGDVDGCMYFIQSGQVDVYDKSGNVEVQNRVLKAGDSFGEAQGLYNIPHDMSYKAHTVVVVVILKYTDWEYLLKWFPASREEIFKKAAENLRLAPLPTPFSATQ